MKIVVLVLSLLYGGSLIAQDIDAVINPASVEKVERVLSADDMRGRKTFTPDIDRAAAYIETQFRQAGLNTLNGSGSYLQTFSLVTTSIRGAEASLDGVQLSSDHIAVVSSAKHLSVDGNSGFEMVSVKAGESMETILTYINQDKKDYLVLMDTSFAKFFQRLGRLTSQHFRSGHSVVFLLTTVKPVHYSISIDQNIEEDQRLTNVVGVLPGKSKKDEYVIFSGHYDHLGVGAPDEKGDSIFNGANDDASGSTAVILLANYFAKLKNNERTLVFVTFTAEEIGGFGSKYFSQQFDPARVMAMFNIEMIGTESKWGTNSAYITGFERTDMGKILQRNLQGTPFTFYPDPYPTEQLFFRSDNARLARQGVAAHTISTSKMDSEKYYHTQGDEIGTLDMKNMALIIKSIALSARTIIAGTDTPSRVDISQLEH